MSIDTAFLRRCIQTLEIVLNGIDKQKEADADLYDIYRVACAKEFELVLEQSGKLRVNALQHTFPATDRRIV